jgi:hypothetical protein
VTSDDAFTLDEFIARLEAIRARHGGDLCVFMSDYEPVCKVCVCEETEFCDKHVIVTDRY